jgi:hemerythrin superfamily protein
MKATDLLKKDHAAVKRLFTQFGKTTARARKTRAQLIDKIATELEIHTKIEEEIFYRAARELEEARSLLEDAQEDHGEMKILVSELRGRGPSSDQAAKVRELKETTTRHVSDEEKELFPLVARLGDERLEQLGSQLEQRKQQLAPQSAERGGKKGRKAA